MHDKKADDVKIARFLLFLESKSDNDRNFLKKAVNWSLRQIGKRNLHSNLLAIATAEKVMGAEDQVRTLDSTNALRELKNETVQRRLRDKKAGPVSGGCSCLAGAAQRHKGKMPRREGSSLWGEEVDRA